MTDEGTPIDKLIHAWLAAVSRRDVDALSRLYSEDAQFWGTMGARLCHGRPEIREYFSRFLDRHWMQADLLELHWQRSGDRTLVAGAYRFSWRDQPDDGLIDARARFTFVLGPTESGWQIFQHHSSAWVVGGL